MRVEKHKDLASQQLELSDFWSSHSFNQAAQVLVTLPQHTSAHHHRYAVVVAQCCCWCYNQQQQKLQPAILKQSNGAFSFPRPLCQGWHVHAPGCPPHTIELFILHSCSMSSCSLSASPAALQAAQTSLSADACLL